MKKFLIISIFSFSLFLGINKVKATYTGTLMTENTDYNIYNISYEEQQRQNWYYVGDFYSQMTYAGTGGSVSNIAIYLNSSNRSIVGFKFAGAIHSLDNLQVVEFVNFTYSNVAIYSQSGASYPMIYLSTGDLPTFGGSCSSGSYCFNFINSGNQGNGYSAVFSSNIIFFTYYYYGGNWLMGGNPYGRFYDYDNGVTWAGTGSPSVNISTTSCQNFMSTQDIKNTSNFTYSNACFSRFELQDSEPEFSYNILEGTEKGKKLEFLFTNFNEENSSAKITNLSSGQVYNVSPLNVGGTTYSYDIDNISYDSTFYIEIYNDGELFDTDTINVDADLILNDSPYINLEIDKEELSSSLGFFNLKSDYKIRYSVNGSNWYSCSDNTFTCISVGVNKIVFFENTGILENINYTVRGQILDSNDNVLYDKGFNVVLFPNNPYFTFNSSYNNNTGGNDITITYHNFLNSDIVSYSFDNVDYFNLPEVNVNTISVYNNTPLYVKAVRGNNTYYGYFYVNLNEYESSANEQNLQTSNNIIDSFKDIFSGVNLSFLDNFGTFFNSLKNSYIFRYLLLIVNGALILFLMKLIRR